MTYAIVRFYKWGAPSNRRIIKAGVSLAEAQAHCANPETSSRTCRRHTGRKRTERFGPWFDGYESEDSAYPVSRESLTVNGLNV